MSEIDHNDNPSPALGAMIEEVRAEQPDVDWARVEARLFDERALQAAPKPNRYAAIAGGLALAAAFAIALISPTKSVDNKRAPVAVNRPAILADDGHTIVPGERIVASQGGWLRSLGRVSVRLEPGTVATVLDVGERVHLALDSGAVVADVTPVAGGEPFAVDVAGKRVAVHGTRLRVALVNGQVQVAVSEGNVVVGAPHGSGRTEGSVVPAGSVGEFGSTTSIVANKDLASHLVDDALVAKITAPAPMQPKAPEVATIPTVIVASAPAVKHPSAMTPPSPPEIAPVVPAPKPGLSSEQLAMPLSDFLAKIGHCAPSTFENTLTLQIDPTGKAELVGEDPGLDSPMRVCVRAELSRVTFPAAEGATTVKRYVKFSGK